MHDHFLAVVRDVLVALNITIAGDGRGMESAIPGLDSDVMADRTFAAARGAALYAKRRLEVQGDCTERKEYEVYRRKERE